MGMNPIYDTIVDAIISCLEQENEGIWLPDEFEIMIPDDAFKLLLKSMVWTTNKVQVDQKLKRIPLNIMDYRVLVRSDQDPEQWAIILRSDALH